jgi:hypothetical protein
MATRPRRGPQVTRRPARSVNVCLVIARTSPPVRLAVRIAAPALAIFTSLVCTAVPALAIGERGTPGGKLTPLTTFAIFVGIPVAVAALIAFLVVLPSMVRGPRYRPGRPWNAAASWFAEPAGGEVAAEAITTLPPATLGGGGASARW